MPDLPSKLRSRKGYTLYEMLVVLALVAIFSLAAVVGINASLQSSMASVRESRVLVVTDTVNAALRDLLVNSDYSGAGDDGGILFTCEKYSGWPMSLETTDGGISAVIHDRFEGKRSEPLLGAAAYAEFAVEDFEINYLDGVYICTYTLVSGDFRRDAAIDISPLNG